MRLVVTGGGTGGHVFPALEVAKASRNAGDDVRYFGSFRGQERAACEKAAMPFVAFASEPVYSLTKIKGIKSLIRLLKSSGQVMRELANVRPDVVFATGGYAAAPVLNAARRMKLPIVIHEQNTVPGRTNRIMSRSARAVCTVFHQTSQHFPHVKTVRTGMPVREVMRQSAQGTLMLDSDPTNSAPMVLVMGGSQGSAALNDIALTTAVRMATTELQWFHLTGLSHFESTMESLNKMGIKSNYVIKAYLEAEQMAAALFQSTVSICRSGAGTLAELAAFRKPSILVPYPQAFGQHQLYNAQEFAEIGAAEVLVQDEIQSMDLEGRILAWLNDKDRVERAQKALAEWDVPDAVPKILSVVRDAATRN